jgi:hypothetical protein
MAGLRGKITTLTAVLKIKWTTCIQQQEQKKKIKIEKGIKGFNWNAPPTPPLTVWCRSCYFLPFLPLAAPSPSSPLRFLGAAADAVGSWGGS